MEPAVVSGFGHFMLDLLIVAAIPAVVIAFFAAAGRARRPALPAPVSPQLAPAHRSAEAVEAFGEHAVQKALRPIWLAKRPTAFNEAELAAWRECAAAFDDEHRQQGWR